MSTGGTSETVRAARTGAALRNHATTTPRGDYDTAEYTEARRGR